MKAIAFKFFKQAYMTWSIQISLTFLSSGIGRQKDPIPVKKENETGYGPIISMKLTDLLDLEPNLTPGKNLECSILEKTHTAVIIV